METINNIESILLEQINLGKNEYIEDIVEYYNRDSKPEKIIEYLPSLIEQLEMSIQNINNKSEQEQKHKDNLDITIINDKLKKYYRQLIDNSHVLKLDNFTLNAYIQKLITLLWKDKNFYEFEQVALIGVKNNCEKSIITLGYYYFKYGNYKLMDKYLLIGIKNGSVKCMYKYAYTLWVREKFDLMEQYVQMAIESSTLEILQTVFGYYYHIEKNYDLIKRYCTVGIKINNVYCMYTLGYYYYYIEKNYKLMEEFFILAAENDCLTSIYTLGNYYQFIKKDYTQMRHYYLMGIERNCYKCMNNYGIYLNVNKNYDLMKRYYQMSIDLGYSKAMHNLANYYLNTEPDHLIALTYYLKAVVHGLFSDFYHIYCIIDNEDNNDKDTLEKFLLLINSNEKLTVDNKIKAEFDKIKLILHHKISIQENTDSIQNLKRHIGTDSNIYDLTNTNSNENLSPNKRFKEVEL